MAFTTTSSYNSLKSSMGASWLAQVRCVHLAMFAMTTIPFFLFLSYISDNQIHTTTPPLRSFDLNLKSNISQILNGATAVRHISEMSEVPAPSVHAPNSNNTSSPDLSRGILAETIFEGGHIDVNPDLCPDMGKNLKLMIIVTSAFGHDSARQAVRETWGHYAMRKDVSMAFILGTTSNASQIENLKKEHEMYGDIIRGKFIDTYDNLTLKTISTLEWVDNFCRDALFVLKTDDDMFINVSRLLAFIAKHKPEERAIYGRLAKKWKPVRSKRSKYYISTDQYKPNVFPDFTTGPAYLLPCNLARELYVAALNCTYLKLEDVLVTGIVANDLKIKRIHAAEFANKRLSFTTCNIQKQISIHMVKSAEQYDLWKKLHESTKC